MDTRVKTKVPEMASLSCADLLTAYRLTQNLNRNKPYKYDPAETMDLHRCTYRCCILYFQICPLLYYFLFLGG